MNKTSFSPLLSAMYVSSSAMQTQNQRILVISENLAHAGMRSNPQNPPYQRKVLSFESIYDKKLQTEIVRVKKTGFDKTPPTRIYSPGDPSADSEGYVLEANVKPFIELADMREAGRSQEANLRAFEKILSMMQNTISLLKN